MVDTNVLISAALKENSVPRRAVTTVVRDHDFIKSTSTERELFATVGRRALHRLIAPDTREWLRVILANAEQIDITQRVTACRDPDDDKFLELAVNGRADAIISGDADLLALHPFRGIPIETPAAFLRRVGA